MYKNLHILLLFVIFFTSCSETVLIDPIEQDKLLIECELNPGKRIEAKVSTIGSFENSLDYTNPSNADIRLYTGVDIELKFEYDSRTGVYYIPQHLHTINPGYQYKIEAFVPNDEQQLKLLSKTNIPSAIPLEVSSVPVVKTIDSGSDAGKKMITLDLKIQIGNKNAPFYRLLVYRKLKNGKTEVLDFEKSESNSLSFQDMMLTNDVLINTSNLESNKLKLTYKTAKSLSEDEQIEKIYYVFETLTEPTYRYFVSKNKQIKAELNGTSEPVINYTNATNGLGFLGASNGVQDSILVK